MRKPSTAEQKAKRAVWDAAHYQKNREKILEYHAAHYQKNREKILEKRRELNAQPGYVNWRKMKERCNNPRDKAYQLYGGAGITYDPLFETYEGFITLLGDPGTYTDKNGNVKKRTLGRTGKGISGWKMPDGTPIPDTGNYEPDNLEWQTKKQQARDNRTKTKLLKQHEVLYGIPHPRSNHRALRTRQELDRDPSGSRPGATRVRPASPRGRDAGTHRASQERPAA